MTRSEFDAHAALMGMASHQELSVEQARILAERALRDRQAPPEPAWTAGEIAWALFWLLVAAGSFAAWLSPLVEWVAP